MCVCICVCVWRKENENSSGDYATWTLDVLLYFDSANLEESIVCELIINNIREYTDLIKSSHTDCAL
jgi:hypothetical protein